MLMRCVLKGLVADSCALASYRAILVERKRGLVVAGIVCALRIVVRGLRSVQRSLHCCSVAELTYCCYSSRLAHQVPWLRHKHVHAQEQHKM